MLTTNEDIRAILRALDARPMTRSEVAKLLGEACIADFDLMQAHGWLAKSHQRRGEYVFYLSRSAPLEQINPQEKSPS